MREMGVIRCKSKYLSAFLVIVMLIGMMTFSSGTAEAWDAQVRPSPQKVYTGEATDFYINVENTGAEAMKVEKVAISFGWQEGDNNWLIFDGEKVLTAGGDETFSETIVIPEGIKTKTVYDAEIQVVASDPDGSGGWQDPYYRLYSGTVEVYKPAETDESNESGGFDWLTILGIIFLLIAAIAFVAYKYVEKEESSKEPQQYQQAGQQPSQQQAPVPPPTQQSSQQPGGQQQPQQSQQSPAPPSPKKCPSCNAEMRYIDEHNSWWCDSCQEYK